MGDIRETGIGTLSLREDGILHAVFDSDEMPTAEVSARYLAIRAELVGSTRPPVVVEILRIPFTARDIRKAFMEDLAPPPCRAVVVSDRTAETAFRSFEFVDPASVPTKVFHRFDRAIAWIHETMEARSP